MEIEIEHPCRMLERSRVCNTSLTVLDAGQLTCFAYQYASLTEDTRKALRNLAVSFKMLFGGPTPGLCCLHRMLQ